MMFYKAFLSMVLIGMVVGDEGDEDVVMNETNDDPPETIMGGTVLSEKERAKRPFLVNVGQTDPVTFQDSFLCGGSLISPSVILTAAHCLYDISQTPWVWDPPHWVDFNRYSKTDATGFQRYSLGPGSAIRHPRYQPGISNDNDVALLILPAVAPAGVTPITLNANPNVPVSSDFPLDVAGWGRIYEDDATVESTDIPYVVTLNYVTNAECVTDYEWQVASITNNMMCAIDVARSSCQGDSGGPLTLGNGGSKGGMLKPELQVGVVSFGWRGCAVPGYPSVYARVSALLPWITNVVTANTGETVSTSAGPASKAAKRLRN